MEKLKTFEEYFWQSSDNDIANKIIDSLNDGIHQEDLSYSDYEYTYIIHRNTNENDPLGEEDWGDNVKIKAIHKVDLLPVVPLAYEIYISKDDGKWIELKTNKSQKIYNLLKKAYKQKDRQFKLEAGNLI